MTPVATQPERWSAWFRPNARAPWRKIGEAADEAAAWKLVLAYPLSGDKTIARPGVDPNKDGR